MLLLHLLKIEKCKHITIMRNEVFRKKWVSVFLRTILPLTFTEKKSLWSAIMFELITGYSNIVYYDFMTLVLSRSLANNPSFILDKCGIMTSDPDVLLFASHFIIIVRWKREMEERHSAHKKYSVYEIIFYCRKKWRLIRIRWHFRNSTKMLVFQNHNHSPQWLSKFYKNVIFLMFAVIVGVGV